MASEGSSVETELKCERLSLRIVERGSCNLLKILVEDRSDSTTVNSGYSYRFAFYAGKNSVYLEANLDSEIAFWCISRFGIVRTPL